MGEVWLARSQGAAGWEKHVALKTILPHLAQHSGFVEQFLDEARIATTLTHGNIVPVFEFGHDQDTYFLAMEYVDGWDLRTLLRRIRSKGDVFPEDLALYIGTEVCRGLDYAHQRRNEQGELSPIIHRDVSPSNILLSRDGEVRLVDFGIASARERLGTTLTGELRGKIAYMSPEQATGQRVDARSDLFSLAVVLYEALAGVRPFDGDTDMEVLHRVQHAEYAPLRSHRDDLSEATYALIDAALQHDPDARFENASAMQMQMLDILYQKTRPVSGRQLAAFCLQYDRRTYDSGIRPGQSFDALLQEQLLTLDDTHTPSYNSNGTPPSALPFRTQTISAQAIGDVRNASPESFETDPRIVASMRQRRRRRTLLAAIAFVVLLIVIVSLAFQLGTRSGTTGPVVRVHTEPHGALIYFDGVSYGRSTLVARPAAGEWLVRAELEGYESDERLIQFDGAEDVEVRFVLEDLPTPLLVEDTEDTTDAAADSATNADVNDAQTDADLAAQGADAPDAQGDDKSDAEGDGDELKTVADAADEPANTPVTAQLTVRGLPTDATLSVDGSRVRGTSSAAFTLGRRARIEAAAPGYERKTVYWTPTSRRDSLDLKLTPLPTGTLTIRFIGDVLIGEVFVNGVSHGVNTEAPRTRVELPIGDHDIRVENKAHNRTFSAKTQVQEDQNTTLTVDWSSD